MRPAFLASFVAISLAAATTAQGVGHDQHVVSLLRNTATTTALVRVDRSGAFANVPGLTMADIGCVQLDPITKRIWIGGEGANQGQVSWLTLDGNGAVASETLHGWVPSQAFPRRVNGITFDDNGNPVCVSARQVWILGRNGGTLASHELLGVIPTSTANTICRDPAGNLYVGSTDVGKIFRLQKNPNATYQAPQLIGSIMPASASFQLSGLDYRPGNPPQLFWTSYSTNGTASGLFPLPAGPAVASGVNFGYWEGIDYDLRLDDFLIVSWSGQVWSLSPTFATTTICNLLPSQGLTGVATSECKDAETTIAPMAVNGQLMTLEVGTCAPPGRPVGIFLTGPILLTLGAGVTDATGRFFVAFPGLRVNAGLPGIIRFTSAYLDANNRLVIGPTKLWPAN